VTHFQASDPENRAKVLNKLYSSTKGTKRSKLEFRAGNRVIIYRYKRTFEKG